MEDFHGFCTFDSLADDKFLKQIENCVNWVEEVNANRLNLPPGNQNANLAAVEIAAVSLVKPPSRTSSRVHPPSSRSRSPHCTSGRQSSPSPRRLPLPPDKPRGRSTEKNASNEAQRPCS